jgi:hypothetical protein
MRLINRHWALILPENTRRQALSPDGISDLYVWWRKML